MASSDKLHILSHPVVRAKITTLREAETSPRDFRDVSLTFTLFHALSLDQTPSRLLSYYCHLVVECERYQLHTGYRSQSGSPRDRGPRGEEISIVLPARRWYHLTSVWLNQIKTSPVATFTGSKIAPTIGLVPILRAGLGMTDALLSLV